MTALRRGAKLAARVFDAELKDNGDVFELRKRLVAKPDRGGTGDQGADNPIAIAYNRRDPVEDTPTDWSDATIFQNPGVETRIWISSKSRDVTLFDYLQKISGRVSARASLKSGIAEGDILVSGTTVWEVLSSNQPTLAACIEIDIIKRG